MARRRIIATIFLLIFVTDVRTQFFDFFGIPPIGQNYQTQKPRNTDSTKRPKIDSIQVTNHRREQTVKKITSVTYTVDESDEGSNSRQNSREKVAKRKNQNNNQNKQNILTLAPINFNFYSTTAKPVTKTAKGTSSQRNNTTNSNKPKDNKLSNQRLPSDYDLYDDFQGERWFDRPAVNNINDYPPNDITTRPNYNNNYNNQNQNKQNRNYDNEYSYPNYNNQFTTKRPDYSYTTTTKRNNAYTTNNPYSVPNYNTYTTKNPYYNVPGVKPAVPAIVENRPPITNKPVNRPVTNKPYTTRPVTKVTKRPVIVQARPTDAGSISFPEDDSSPDILIGPDEDYMSETEKRRYIDMAERMCDKYKYLNMKQVQAIPLLPSPEPVQLNVSSCAPVNIPLVVGGKIVKIDEFPHMALLGWLKLEGPGYSWKCGGSLISDQYVLTASHCSYQERDNTVVAGAPRAVQLGSSYLDDSGALVVKVASVVRHPKYKSPRSYYDIALLKLVHPVTFSQVIKPACLGVPPPVDNPIIATGWGRTESSDQSQELRSVSLPIWDITKCAEVLGTSRKLPTGPSSESQVCAGEIRGGKDTCQGDSGGPAQTQEGCIWRIVAVTSLGRSCGAPNTPGLYAKVPRAFIAAQVFGDYRSTAKPTTTERNYQNNQQAYNNNQQGYNNNQQSTSNQNYNQQQNNQNYNQQQNNQNYNQQQNNQNYDQQQNNYNNNQRRDYRNDNSNYNLQTSTNRIYRSDENNYSYENYQDSNQRRDETDPEKNHRNVDVNAALISNNQEYNQNGRNYNTDVNAYNNQQNYGNNYNNNQRRDYRDNNNQNDYNYNNRNGDYSGINQHNYNTRDIGSDSGRILFT